MTEWKDPRLLIAVLLIAMFGLAYFTGPRDEMMKGAMIAALSTAVGYWLGSSSGSREKTEALTRRPTGEPSDPVYVEDE